jgi:hypothetical protein
MDGIMVKDSNPYIKDSWIEQGYPSVTDRWEPAPKMSKRRIEQIWSFMEENNYHYPYEIPDTFRYNSVI